jgi:hypothetical protein
MVRPEGVGKRKMLMTQSGNEPPTYLDLITQVIFGEKHMVAGVIKQVAT